MSELDQLAQHRNDILLAELAGLLHNIGKLNPNFLKSTVIDESNAVQMLQQHNQFVDGYAFKRFAKPSEDVLSSSVKTLLANSTKLNTSQLPSTFTSDLEKAQQKAAETFNRLYRGVGPLNDKQAQAFVDMLLEISGEKWQLADLLTLFWDEFFYKPNNNDYQRTYALDRWLSDPPNGLPHLLIHAHGEISGSEKYQITEDEDTGAIGTQGVRQEKSSFDDLRIATAFGYETVVPIWNLRNKQQNLINQVPRVSLDNEKWRLQFQGILRHGLGDTQRPINEITLWDYASSIAALFKTSIAKSFLEGQVVDANQMHWRLFGVRFDGLDYVLQADRISDLVGRQQKYQEILNRICFALSQETPVASQVYQDENGLFFVVPDSDKLRLDDLQALIEKQLKSGNFTDLQPYTDWSQDKLRGKQLNLGQELKRQDEAKRPSVRPELAEEWWRNRSAQICEVCGLRPAISKEIKYCTTCRGTRNGRVQTWLRSLATTIWLDEVADEHGRLALISGYFPLNGWLNGKLVESLALGMNENSGQPVPKFASFPRIQRIWQTTQTFWRQTQADIDQTLSDDRRRLQITLADTSNLTAHQTYELDLRGQTRMSVLWDGSHLISTDNLTYTAIQLGVKSEDRTTPADAALAVGTWLEANRQESFQLISDDEKNRQFNIKVADIDYQNTAYTATIPILAEPRTFLSLVPADKALDVVNAIRAKYEREMGKVRNRLPLHLGIVYFQRRTPLRSALDAGRRMLKYEGRKTQDNIWTVKRDAQAGPLPGDRADLAQGTQHFTQTIPVKLEQNGRSFTWHVPAVMGDGVTPDNWYPYVFIQNDVSDRQCIFKAPHPNSNGETEECWLIHAAGLKAGDQVYFTPATLDFQWLDSAGQRFEIAYDEQGRRRNSLTRPYLLDQLDEIEKAWGMLHKLSKSQLYALRDAVEEKRAAWFSDTPAQSFTEDTFQRFCRDVILTTKWPTSLLTAKEGKKRLPQDRTDQLTAWAINGLLADAIELHVSIMKEDQQTEAQPNE